MSSVPQTQRDNDTEGGGHQAVLSHPPRREGMGGERMEGRREGGPPEGDRAAGWADTPWTQGTHVLSQASAGLYRAIGNPCVVSCGGGVSRMSAPKCGVCDCHSNMSSLGVFVVEQSTGTQIRDSLSFLPGSSPPSPSAFAPWRLWAEGRGCCGGRAGPYGLSAPEKERWGTVWGSAGLKGWQCPEPRRL